MNADWIGLALVAPLVVTLFAFGGVGLTWGLAILIGAVLLRALLWLLFGP